MNSDELPLTEAERRTRWRDLLLCLLIAGGVWLVVSSLSVFVAWQNALSADLAWREQWLTQRQLKEIAGAITQYEQKYHAAPRSFDQILEMTNAFQFHFPRGGVDGWNHPFHLSNDGTKVVVTSYGRDGQPGGRGLDCDLTTQDWNPKEALPTFGQFLSNPRVEGMKVSCVVCGGIAFLLSLSTIKRWDSSGSGLFALGMRLCGTVIGALLIAIIISAMHVPSGH